MQIDSKIDMYWADVMLKDRCRTLSDQDIPFRHRLTRRHPSLSSHAPLAHTPSPRRPLCTASTPQELTCTLHLSRIRLATSVMKERQA